MSVIYYIQVDVGEPGSAQHRRREAILRKAIKTRDDILAVKSQYDEIADRIRRAAEGMEHATSHL